MIMMIYHSTPSSQDVPLCKSQSRIGKRIKHLRLFGTFLANQTPIFALGDLPSRNHLAQRMSMRPECKGMNLPGVFNVAGHLKEGGGVRRSHAAGAEENDARGLRLLLFRVVKNDSGVVARFRYLIQMGVMDL